MFAAPTLVGLAGDLPPTLVNEWADHGVGLLRIPPGTADDRVGDVAETRIDTPDVVILSVQVVFNRAGGVDFGPLVDTTEAVGRHLRPGQLVIVTGLVPPGTTRRTVQPALTKYGPTAGVGVAYTPDLVSGPRVVGGLDAATSAAAAAALARLGRHVRPVSSAETAEVCGTATAVVRTAHAALATELHRAWEQMGVDGREVTEAVGLSDLHPHRPGEDAALLFSWGCRRYRANTRALTTAIEVNATVAEALAERMTDALNRLDHPVRGSRVVVVCRSGEEATEPVAGVVWRLFAQGAAVRVHTPRAPLPAEAMTGELGILLLADPPPGWHPECRAIAVVDAR